MPINKKVNVETQSVSFEFEDGETAVYELSRLSPAMVVQLALSRLKNKLGDTYAGDKIRAKELVANCFQNLLDGNWSVRGEGGTRVTQLVRALVMKLAAEGKEITEADAAEKLKDLPDETKKALAAALVSELAQVKAADAAAAAEKAQQKAEAAEPSDLDISALLG